MNIIYTCQNLKKIIKNANVLYKQVMQYNMQIKERCCRYRF